jgi:hypothetical protein
MPQDSLFGVGIQRGSGATDYDKMADGYNEPETDDVYYYPFTDSNVSITKQQDSLPPMCGGKALTQGMFVTGVWGGGDVSMVPFLDNRLGWLLLAMLGEVSTVADIKADDLGICGGSGVSGDTTGVHSHIFTLEDSDQFFTPWLTIHKKLPHVSSAEEVGEKMQDGRIGQATFNIASGAPVTLDLSLLARRLQASEEFDVDPGWTATFDDFADFPVPSCEGHFKVEGVELDVTNVSVQVNNDLLPSAQSVTVGSVDPKDHPNTGRTITVTATILIEDYDFYLQTFTADQSVDVSSGSDQTATCTVYKGDLDVMVASQTAIGAADDATEKHKLRFVSNNDQNNVGWQVTPIRSTPGRPVVLQVQGEVEALSSGQPFYCILQNGQADYNLS